MKYVNKHSLKSLEVFASTGEPWNPDPWMWLFETVGKEMSQSVTTQVELKSLVGFSVCSYIKPIAPISFNASLPGMAAVVLDDQR